MKKLFFSALVMLSVFSAQADSPLTSTNFYTVYEEYDIVNEALAAQGQLTNNLMLYLSDKGYPIDVKVAVINALGWHFNGKNNYEKYLDFIEMRTGLERTQDIFYKHIDADELLCLAYLKAMDNHFDVGDAKVISEFAVNKSRRSEHSYTFNLIGALIGAQMEMQGNWCKMYEIPQAVRTNSKLRNDFPPEAIRIVFDYMELYKAECK